MDTGLSALDLLSAAAFAHEEHRAHVHQPEREYPLDPALEPQFAPFQNGQLPPLPPESYEAYEPAPPAPVVEQQADDDGDKTDDDDTLAGPRITFKRPRDDDDPDPGRQLNGLGAHHEPPPFFAPSSLPSLASLGTFPPSSLPPLPSLSSSFLPPLPDLAHFTVLPPIPTTTSPYHPAPPSQHPHPQSLPHWVPEDAGLIRCVCPYTSDDGFTIQCDMCNVWQHAGCVSISPEDVPDEYLCELCDPRGAHERGVDGQRAEESQRRRMEAELRRAGDGEMRRGASVGVGAQVRQHQEIIQQQLQQQQQREHEHAVAAAALEQPAPRGKPRRSLTDDGLATPADASPVESLPATPAAAPPAQPRNARKRGGAKQAAPNGSSAPSRSRAAVNPPTPAQSNTSTPANDHQPDHYRQQHQQAPAPRTNGHGPAVTPAYSDDDDVDERYETWQYEYTPVERNLYPDASLVARLVDVLADDAHPLLRDLWDRQAAVRPRAKDPLMPLLYDSAPVEFDTLPTPAATAVKPLTGATFHLAPPIASTYVPSSNQGPACPYPRPTVHALFASAPIAAGAFVGALRGEVVPLATYRADPLSQYALLGVPKQGVRTLPVPWSVAIDQRRFGNELRFARSGCHPNALVRVVRLGSTPADSPVAWASQASGRPLGQLVFAVFATVDIGRREEIVLPWDWDDDHIVHALQGLMLAPPLPPGIVHEDLEPLARKMAAVATTLLGTNHCACDKKRDCALFWMCRAAGATAPMSKAAAAKREPFATILLNAMGAGKDDGAARGKARKAKKPDVGPLLGLERGWIKRELRVVEPTPPPPVPEPEPVPESVPVVEVVVEPRREDEKENVDAMEVDEPSPVVAKSTLADLPHQPTPLASTSSLPTPAATVIELPPAEPTPSTASKQRQSNSRPAPPKIEEDVDSDGSDLTEPLSHRSDDDLAPASTKADESDNEAPPAPVRRRVPVPAKRTAKDVGPARKKARTVVEDKDKGRKKKLDKGKGRARESSDEPPAAAERKAAAPAAPEPPKEKKKKQIVVIKKVTETLVEKPVDLVALREKKERKEREREKDRKDREKAQREKDREEKRERERRREEEEDEQSDDSESEDDAPPPPPKKRGSKSKPPAPAPAPAPVPRGPSPVVDPVEAARLEAMIFDGPAEVVVHKLASPPPPPPRKLTMEDYRRMRKNPDAAAQPAESAALESAVVAKQSDSPATEDVVIADPKPEVPPVPEPAPEPIVIEVVKEPTPPPPPPPVPRARLSLAAYRQRQQEQAQKPSDAPSESLAAPTVAASELVASPLTTPSLAQPTPPPATTSASESSTVPSSFNSAAAEDVLKRLGDYFSSQAAPAPVAPAAPQPPPPSGPLSYTRAPRRPTPPRRPSPPPRRERSRTPPTPEPHSPRSPIQPAFDIPLRAPASFIKPESRRTSGGLGLDAELPLSTREYGRQPSVYTSSSFSLGKSDSGSPLLSVSPSLFQQPLPAAFSPPARSPSLHPAPPPNAPTGPRASPTLRYDRPPGEIPTGPRASPNAGYSGGSGSGRAYNRPLPDVGASPYAQPAPLTYGPGPIPATGASAVPLGPRGFGVPPNNAPRASWPPQGHSQGPATPGFRGTPRGHFVPRGPSMRGGRGGGPPPGPVGPSSRGALRGRGGGVHGDGGWGPSRGRGRGRG